MAKTAVKQVWRHPETRLAFVYFADADTGAALNSLDGYTVSEAGSNINAPIGIQPASAQPAPTQEQPPVNTPLTASEARGGGEFIPVDKKAKAKELLAMPNAEQDPATGIIKVPTPSSGGFMAYDPNTGWSAYTNENGITTTFDAQGNILGGPGLSSQLGTRSGSSALWEDVGNIPLLGGVLNTVTNFLGGRGNQSNVENPASGWANSGTNYQVQDLNGGQGKIQTVSSQSGARTGGFNVNTPELNEKTYGNNRTNYGNPTGPQNFGVVNKGFSFQNSVPDNSPAIQAETPSGRPSMRDLESYIVEAAKVRGVDPQKSLSVAKSEGLNSLGYKTENLQSQVTDPKTGQKEPSYGAFQMYMNGGLGNEFQKDTGLDPRDPKAAFAIVDYALDHVVKNGWGAWAGARKQGIVGMDGVSKNAKPMGISEAALEYARNGFTTANPEKINNSVLDTSYSVSNPKPMASDQMSRFNKTGSFNPQNSNGFMGIPSGLGNKFERTNSIPESGLLSSTWANNTPSATQGRVSFNNAGQDKGLKEQTSRALEAIAAKWGDTSVISGFRDAAYNAKVGGAKNSTHTKGTTVDLDIGTIPENKKAEYVQDLVSLGASRIASYSKNPGMLHVEFGTYNVPQGKTQFFHADTGNSWRGLNEAKNTPQYMREAQAAISGNPEKFSQTKSSLVSENPTANFARGFYDRPLSPIGGIYTSMDAAKRTQQAFGNPFQMDRQLGAIPPSTEEIPEVNRNSVSLSGIMEGGKNFLGGIGKAITGFLTPEISTLRESFTPRTEEERLADLPENSIAKAGTQVAAPATPAQVDPTYDMEQARRDAVSRRAEQMSKSRAEEVYFPTYAEDLDYPSVLTPVKPSVPQGFFGQEGGIPQVSQQSQAVPIGSVDGKVPAQPLSWAQEVAGNIIGWAIDKTLADSRPQQRATETLAPSSGFMGNSPASFRDAQNEQIREGLQLKEDLMGELSGKNAFQSGSSSFLPAGPAVSAALNAWDTYARENDYPSTWQTGVAALSGVYDTVHDTLRTLNNNYQATRNFDDIVKAAEEITKQNSATAQPVSSRSFDPRSVYDQPMDSGGKFGGLGDISSGRSVFSDIGNFAQLSFNQSQAEQAAERQAAQIAAQIAAAYGGGGSGGSVSTAGPSGGFDSGIYSGPSGWESSGGGVWDSLGSGSAIDYGGGGWAGSAASGIGAAGSGVSSAGSSGVGTAGSSGRGSSTGSASSGAGTAGSASSSGGLSGAASGAGTASGGFNSAPGSTSGGYGGYGGWSGDGGWW